MVKFRRYYFAFFLIYSTFARHFDHIIHKNNEKVIFEISCYGLDAHDVCNRKCTVNQ